MGADINCQFTRETKGVHVAQENGRRHYAAELLLFCDVTYLSLETLAKGNGHKIYVVAESEVTCPLVEGNQVC